jgi:ATP-dependent RNA helicase DeaD
MRSAQQIAAVSDFFAAIAGVLSRSVASAPEIAFAALGAHPALERALTERGYAVPTPVQIAVLSAPTADLLVSSQTGSGKTVAFGLLLGRVLLGEAEKIEHRAAPRALVIAPTRELAAQVRRELAWLFAETGASMTAFTGGTDLRLDARALRRGVDVVVGTPGRLLDLLERKSLVLSSLQAVVLDEADEMLDLGFREPLEKLLEAAPAERRTWLFSATLPPAIRALAARYQRDAQRVDPRAGAPAAHEDIRHVAHLCADGERLAALVNVLRYHPSDRALVFCRTRENVAVVHQHLSTRGIKAAAISGERAQADRTRALESLRHGRVRVLVATNVAARGLDLPDVSLVLHVDLPDNAEALTHRSGRTGRAGKKGVNVFIVERGVRRRAERLFSEAHLRLTFTLPPNAESIAAEEQLRLRAELAEQLERPPSPAASALAGQLLAEGDALAIVAALLDRVLKDVPTGEALTPIELSPPPRAAKTASARGEMVGFRINLGAKNQAQANWILPLICRRGGITRREVGAIRVARDHTYFEVAARAATEFAANASERDPRAPHVHIEPFDGPLPAAGFRPPPGAGHRPPPRRSPPKRHPRH